MLKRKARKTSALLVCAGLALCARWGGAADVRGKAGAGTGLAYGSPLPGVGAELELGEHVSMLGGVGVLAAETTWSYGVRVYFQGRERKFRPHVSLFQWTEGNGVYVGVDHDVGKPSGFNLTYAVGYGDVNLEGRVALTFGVGYRF